MSAADEPTTWRQLGRECVVLFVGGAALGGGACLGWQIVRGLVRLLGDA